MFGCMIRYRQDLSRATRFVVCDCLPALAARLGGHGRERLHACLPLQPDYVVTGEKDCMPVIIAQLGGRGREKLHACLPLLPE